MHLVPKGPIAHQTAPAEEHRLPQRVRALTAVLAPLDPAPDGLIPIAFEQMLGLLNLTNLGESLRQLVLARIGGRLAHQNRGCCHPMPNRAGQALEFLPVIAIRRVETRPFSKVFRGP